MSYSVELILKPGYLRAEISGTRTRFDATKDALKAWGEVTKMAMELGQDRVMAVVQLEGSLDLFRAMEMGRGLGLHGWNTSSKLAFVNQSLQSAHAVSLAASIAKQNGFDIRVFSRESTAEDWLLGDFEEIE